MLMQAIQAEVDVFVEGHADLVDDQGRKRIVRNGHAPERQIQTGIAIEQRPRVRDRAGDAPPIRFTSAVLPACCGGPRTSRTVALALSERPRPGSSRKPWPFFSARGGAFTDHDPTPGRVWQDGTSAGKAAIFP